MLRHLAPIERRSRKLFDFSVIPVNFMLLLSTVIHAFLGFGGFGQSGSNAFLACSELHTYPLEREQTNEGETLDCL